MHFVCEAAVYLVGTIPHHFAPVNMNKKYIKRKPKQKQHVKKQKQNSHADQRFIYLKFISNKRTSNVIAVRSIYVCLVYVVSRLHLRPMNGFEVFMIFRAYNAQAQW